MHLHEVLGWSGPMTLRQFHAWREWMNGELNEDTPERVYLLRILHAVRRGNGEAVTQDDCKVKFAPPPKPRPHVPDEELLPPDWKGGAPPRRMTREDVERAGRDMRRAQISRGRRPRQGEE